MAFEINTFMLCFILVDFYVLLNVDQPLMEKHPAQGKVWKSKDFNIMLNINVKIESNRQ